MSKIFNRVILIFLLVVHIAAKSFGPCELVTELNQVYNFTYEESRNLLCVAQKLSGLNTNVIGGDLYGIFQIHKNYCNEGNRKGEFCDIDCNDLLDDQISDDVSCVEKILLNRGLDAWRFDKKNGCRKIFKNLDKKCTKKFDRCDYAKKLSSTYNISQADAFVWSCIAENDEAKLKTGKMNETCVECAIKKSGFFHDWPSYKKCKSFDGTELKNCFKNVEIIYVKNRKFTTSTEISIIYDVDTTTEKQKISEKIQGSTDEGYSKVSVMKNEEKAKDDFDDFDDEWFKEEIPEKYEIIDQYYLVDKCHLAESIKDYGNISHHLIPTLVCIAEHESRLNISAKTTSNGITKYGLFQIDDSTYCNTNEDIKECDILCEHLNDDQFNNDLECVNKIYEKEAFNYWRNTYERYCSNIKEDSLNYCFAKLTTTTHRPFTIVNSFHVTADNLSSTESPPMNETSERDDKFDLCKFVSFLHTNQIHLDHLASIACIADNQLNETFGPFGLKQEHCNACKINCSNLIDSYSLDELKCAQEILNKNGLIEWNLEHETCQRKYNSKILQCIEDGKFDIEFETESNTEMEQTTKKELETTSKCEDCIDDTTLKNSNQVNDDFVSESESMRKARSDENESFYSSIFEIFSFLNSMNSRK